MDNILSLEDARLVCESQGVPLKPGTLRYFAEGKKKPALRAKKFGRDWIVTRSDLMKWIAVYKTLPPRGVRRGIKAKEAEE